MEFLPVKSGIFGEDFQIQWNAPLGKLYRADFIPQAVQSSFFRSSGFRVSGWVGRRDDGSVGGDLVRLSG